MKGTRNFETCHRCGRRCKRGTAGHCVVVLFHGKAGLSPATEQARERFYRLRGAIGYDHDRAEVGQ